MVRGRGREREIEEWRKWVEVKGKEGENRRKGRERKGGGELNGREKEEEERK